MTTEFTTDFLHRAAIWLDWDNTPEGLSKREADLELIQELTRQTMQSATTAQKKNRGHFFDCH
jgi:hypothetical protein